MKKIITVTAIVLVIACLCGVLAACSSTKSVSLKKAKISVEYTPKATLGSAGVSEVTALLGTTYSYESEGILVLTYKYQEETNYFTLYNVKTNTVLASSSTDTFNIYSNGSNTFFTRSTKDVVSNSWRTTLYNSNGEEVKYLDAAGVEQNVFVSDEIPEVNHVTYDVYKYADNYFRVAGDGEGVERIGRVSTLSNFNYNFSNIKSDNYYYQIQEGNGRAFIFDKSLNLVSSYFATGKYDEIDIYVMEDGNLLVQTITELMDEDKEYTYISNATKYEMKTYVVKAKDGKVSEKKFEYRINYLASATEVAEDQDIVVDAENLAVLYAIEDGHLKNGNNDTMIVSLTNGLSIKGRLDQLINGQTPGTFISRINGYVRIATPLGNKLATTEGEVLGDFSYDNKNDSLFTRNGKIYDYSLKQLFDYTTEGYTYVGMMNNSVILTKEVEENTYTYRFDATMTTPKQLTTSTTFFGYVNQYMYYIRTVVDGKNVYTYYNEKDEMIGNLPTTATISNKTWDSENEFGLYSASVYDSTEMMYKTHYYRISK